MKTLIRLSVFLLIIIIYLFLRKAFPTEKDKQESFKVIKKNIMVYEPKKTALSYTPSQLHFDQVDFSDPKDIALSITEYSGIDCSLKNMVYCEARAKDCWDGLEEKNGKYYCYTQKKYCLSTKSNEFTDLAEKIVTLHDQNTDKAEEVLVKAIKDNFFKDCLIDSEDLVFCEVTPNALSEDEKFEKDGHYFAQVPEYLCVRDLED